MGLAAAKGHARWATRSKYGAVRVTVDGRRFDSKREAARYRELRLRESLGEIEALECQVVYYLWAGIPEFGAHRAVQLPKHWQYRLDFRYREVATGELVHEDVKGYRAKGDPVYRLFALKRLLVETTYGIEIREV
jgi:hypothetical protein